jgi:hypothetical protein
MSMLPALLALIGIPLLVYTLAFRNHRRDARAGVGMPPVVSMAIRVWAYQQVLVPLLALLALAAIAASYFLYEARMSPAERDAFLRTPPSLQQEAEESQRMRQEQAIQSRSDADRLRGLPKPGGAP